jgi:hypothetical protein
MEDKIKKTVMEEAKKRGLILEQESDKGDFVEMISLLFHSRTQAHTFHLQTESFAEHKALEGYYDGIVGLIDSITESYQGKYGIVKGYKNYPLVEYKGNESTVSFFHNVCDKVTKLRDCCKDSWLQNEIDNVCTLISQTLYKLKFLK